ncbi:MAG: glycosyltransferase [Chloroflexota bacterium]
MSHSPRVVHVIHSGAVGGGPRVVLSLATGVPGEHVIAAPADGPLLADAQREGVDTARLPRGGKYSFPVSAPSLRAAVATADIVHVHGQFAGFYAGVIARTCRKRVVYTAHFPSFVTDSGPRNRIRNRLVEATSCAAAQVTVACSQTMREEYIRRRLTKSHDIVTIYNGVPEQHATVPVERVRDDLGVGLEEQVILGLGRFTDQKGFDVLLEAMRIVLCRAPQAVLTLAGDGERRQALEDRARRLEIYSSVRFAGFRRDTADLMNIAAVVAVPSRYEVFPLVALEAMMAGRALVATDLPVLREAITGGEQGFLVPLDPGALADGLIRLLEDADLRRLMGTAGRRRAQARFGEDRMAGEYATLYERVLEPA